MDCGNVVAIVQLVTQVLKNDWSKAVQLEPVIRRIYAIVQRWVPPHRRVTAGTWRLLNDRKIEKVADLLNRAGTAHNARLLRNYVSLCFDFTCNHKYYNFLESDWSINPPIRALIGHLQSEIVILMINW